ncbi:MAG: hypothetical protein GX322_08565 [Firmicutes bacterium]|nr:hypothetical protein [Bacillota bacterium]
MVSISTDDIGDTDSPGYCIIDTAGTVDISGTNGGGERALDNHTNYRWCEKIGPRRIITRLGSLIG